MLELDRHHNRISEILGGISVERVQRVIEKTTMEGHLVHGVKWRGRWDLVRSEGVRPLTPAASGNVSFWTSGVRMFTASVNPNSTEYGYDSSIFHYGCEFLALTNRRLLSTLGITPKFLADGTVVISECVPRKSVVILETGRYSDKTGRKIFELLERTLQGGYGGGEHIKG